MKSKFFRSLLALTVALCLLAALPSLAEARYPAQGETVTDDANVLSQTMARDIASYAEEAEDETQDSKDTVSANTVTSNNTVTAAVADDSNKIFIESPEGSEVYLDTNYVGIAPISFLKTAGTHVITLRKNGYVTKSYTIQVDSVKKDVTYSFSDLISES